MQTPLDNAIRALKLAIGCGGHIGVNVCGRAHEELVAMRAAILMHDAKLNEQGIAPDGSDYNLLYAQLGLQAQLDEQPAAVAPSETNVQQDPAVATQSGPDWMMSVPVLSTAHVSKATDDFIMMERDSTPWMRCANYDMGYFISVPDSDLATCPKEMPPAPQDLKDIWAWARARDHDWVRLDSNAEVIDGLPTYDR